MSRSKALKIRQVRHRSRPLIISGAAPFPLRDVTNAAALLRVAFVRVCQD
jgi:hypothetical protein